MTDLSRGFLAGDAVPALAPALSEFVAERLREAIAQRHLAAGQSLPETELAASLGVSRGPVREALAKLEREGLVRLRRHRSAQVVELTREDVEEVYTLRVALERLAAVRAAERVRPDHLDQMTKVISLLGELSESSTPKEAADLDLGFHDVIYAASGHSRLQRAWTEIRPQVYMFLLTRNYVTRDFSQLAMAEHTEVRDVIAAGDREKADQLIQTHIAGGYDRLIVNLFGENPPDM